MSTSIFKSSDLILQKTGLAPTYKIAFVDATYVKFVVITSSSFPISKARIAKCKAEVPLEVVVQ